MNSRHFVRIYFVVASAACVGLAVWWWTLFHRGPTQVDGMRSVRAQRVASVPTPPSPTASAPEVIDPSGPAETETGLLRYASQSNRRARAAAVLAWVERMKASPRPEPAAELPPPPRSLMGIWFPELLKDPEVGAEYRRLYRELMMSSRSMAVRGGLASPSSDMRSYAALMGDSAVLDLVVDRELAMLERYAIPKDQRDGAEGQALQARQTQLEAQLNALVRERYGPDEYARLTTGKGMEFEGVLGTLEQRLSYATEPLTAKQRADLKAALAAAAPNTPGPIDVGRQMAAGYTVQAQEARAAQLLQSAAAVLSPTQFAAFRDVQEERLAVTRRRQLPVDSELPKVPGT